MKELLITLTPSQMLYIQALKGILKTKGNRQFILEIFRLAETSLEKGNYLGKARLGLLILSLGINPKSKRHFKVFLSQKEYSKFWLLAEKLELETKSQTMIGLCLLAEKSLYYVVAEILNRVSSNFIKGEKNSLT